MLTPRSMANKMGAPITKPHPMASPELGSLWTFAQADANSRMTTGIATNVSENGKVVAKKP